MDICIEGFSYTIPVSDRQHATETYVQLHGQVSGDTWSGLVSLKIAYSGGRVEAFPYGKALVSLDTVGMPFISWAVISILDGAEVLPAGEGGVSEPGGYASIPESTAE